MPETLYLTVYVIDQYLSMENVPRKELQLVGISAMLIACKYEEIWAPMVGFLTLILSICASKHTSSILCITYTMQQCIQIKDLLCLCDNAFSREQVLTKEKAILNKLHWNLTVPTMYMFIVRYLKAARGDKKVQLSILSNFLAPHLFTNWYVISNFFFYVRCSLKTWHSSTPSLHWFSTRCWFTLHLWPQLLLSMLLEILLKWSHCGLIFWSITLA